MSIATVLAQVEIAIEPIITAAKELAATAVNYLKDVAISLPQKAVAFIKETPLGTAIMNLISAASTTTASGTEKMAGVIGAAQAAYDAFVANGGLTGLLTAGLSVLRQLAQSLYDDFAATFLKAA